MVLSLVDLALISIMDGIKDGTIQNPYMLPPMLRQLVLDTAINRGIIDDPYCLALLISILNDTKSISIQIDWRYTNEFFQRLKESMRAMLLNGERMDAAVTKLHLRDFRFDTTFRYSYRGRWNRVLENWAENCIELSISNSLDLHSGRPIINFNQLTTLKLDSCGIAINVWQEFLRHLPTLEHLQMIDVTFRSDSGLEVLDNFLPFSMPRLKSLEIIGKQRWWLHFICNKAFVDNLMGCPELRRVHLMLDKKSAEEAILIQLVSMVANRDIAMKIKAGFDVDDSDNADSAAFDSSSKFKIVRIFHEWIDSIDFCPFGEWKPRFSTALEDIVTTCLNLTSFHISTDDAGPISGDEMKRINAALVRFFANLDRALQLKDLYLYGNFDVAVLSAVFENCMNLVQLNISCCPALRDQHFIDWVVRGGGKLSKFSLYNCENVTSEGIIPILIRSAEELLGYNICVGESSGGRNWKAVLEKHCPNAQRG